MIRAFLLLTALALALPAMALAQTRDAPAAESAAPAAESGPTARSGLESVEARYSYGLGIQIGQTLRQNGIDRGLDADAFALGIRDVLTGTEPRLSLSEIQAAIETVQQALADEARQRAAAAKSAGEAFLSGNTANEGVVATESGLQYRVMTEGQGDGPTADDTVQVHYEGKLLDGSIFDSSYARGEPISFPVGGVIQGWQEVLQLMRPGAVFEVWIPSELAYGEQGAGNDIGPNEVLHFKIELIEIVDG